MVPGRLDSRQRPILHDPKGERIIPPDVSISGATDIIMSQRAPPSSDVPPVRLLDSPSASHPDATMGPAWHYTMRLLQRTVQGLAHRVAQRPAAVPQKQAYMGRTGRLQVAGCRCRRSWRAKLLETWRWQMSDGRLAPAVGAAAVRDGPT
ncbi:uncharacterized protein BO80DRAFT_193650 [Aspergillus ibericus CBS 121593]|uniref:Uncharacterized protein n=1 Tax=Aspergillus ibericus CBS 121593 TaxID=1448316 RepID=A0A395GP43_9EURO|nr:hypothetical protein BO80DRAFT_193650 [Aspergillus ibericus CBS 121593]RAK97280.1 hypothetical protein BO80DRAFT_193650 [Aspergillus ibericus CBS 121593]